MKPHGSGVDSQPSQEPPTAGNDSTGLSTYATRTKPKRRSGSSVKWEALIDRGANGCIAGRDMRVIEKTDRTIDLSGLDDHTVRNLNIVSVGAVVRTQLGEIIIVLH